MKPVKKSARSTRDEVNDNVERYVLAAVAKETRARGPLPKCDSADVLQEVLIELANKHNKPGTWDWGIIHDDLREITRKAVRRPHNRARKQKQRGTPQEVSLKEASEIATPSFAPKVDLALDVKSAIEGLTERQQKIASLLSFGFKRNEIAEQLGVTRQTVSAEVKRIRAALSGMDEPE